MPSLASSDSGRSFRRHHSSIARACAETLEQRQLLSAPTGDHMFPIAYTRSGINGDVKATAKPKFKIAKVPAQNGTYKIRGQALFRGALGLPYVSEYFPAEAATLDAQGILTTANAIVATIKVPEYIYKADMRIVWQLGVQQGNEWAWQTVGESSNTMYVSGAELTQSVFHSVLDVGCRSAFGTSPVGDAGIDQVMAKIWSEFDDLDVRNSAGELLTYYGTPTTGEWYTTGDLLAHKDGRCGAWTLFLSDVLDAQGVAPNFVPVIHPPDHPTAGPDGFPTFVPGSERLLVYPTIKGQGDAIPHQNLFIDHRVVVFRGKIYDVSYGKKWSTRTEWENASLSEFQYTWRSAIGIEDVQHVPDKKGVLDTWGMQGAGVP